MPLVLAATIAWIGGTTAGLAGIGAGALLPITGAILLGAWRGGGGSWPALLVVGVGGYFLGADLRGADAACLDRAVRGREWEVELATAVADGSFAHGELAAPECRVRVALLAPRGAASAGSRVRVTAAAVTADGGSLLLRNGRVAEVRAPGALARWRARVAAKLDRRFGEDAPVVRSLLIADTRGLDPTLRSRYADAGLVHLLSISGLHVAIVGGTLLLLFEAARLPGRAAAAAAVATTVLYVLAIGAPAPAVRSVTLFALASLSRVAQRPVSPWGAFALGALLPLLEPRTVLDLGWQLSVAGYAAVVVSGRASRRLPEEWAGWRGALARELVAGALATLVTAPLVAWHFGRLSLVAPVSNIAAGPVITLLQPTLFLAMLLPDALGAALVADAARPLLGAMDRIAEVSASFAWSSVSVAPSLSTALLAATAVAALLVAAWVRDGARPLIVGASAVALMLWIPLVPGGASHAELHLIDVGQGDAIALRTPRGRWILMDAGRSWRSNDAGRTVVIPYLRRRGGEVAMLVLSHPHADHIGGALSVIAALRPPDVRDGAYVEPSGIYRELLAGVGGHGARWTRVRPGDRAAIDGVELEFLAPDSGWTAGLDDPNEASVVVRVRHGENRFLLTGDAERGEEEWLLERDPSAVTAEVLKVGHHGSRTSSTERFIEAVAPRLALVSVGAGNSYGHPSPEVMARLLDAGATVLRTDQLGTVIVRSDGTSLEVEAGGHRWRVTRSLPGPW